MKGRTWWWVAIAAVVALPLATMGAAAALLDPNDYKQTLVDAVQSATGRALGLNGNVRISRSLWPSIEVSDVTLSNLPGGSRPDIARAERIQAELSLPALFRREIEVVKLTLTGPNILFEQVGNAPNWVFDPPGDPAPSGTALPPSSATAPAPAAPGTEAPFRLRIRAVTVLNGMVTWRFPARTKVVGIRSLDLRHPTDDGPLDLKAVLVYGDNQPFGLQASATPTGPLRAPWRTTIGFQAFDSAASASGTVDLAGAFDLKLEAKSGALDALNALLPEMRLPPVHHAVLSARLQNGPTLGALPVVGATRFRFDDADLGRFVSGLTLGGPSSR